MASMIIIADDLSGAADCGIACTAAGLDTLVILGDRAEIPDAEALAVDADTRGRSQAEAVSEIMRLTRLYARPGRLLFKKLDSTLRGHVGAELAAMLRIVRETGPATIVMAPAFPATGRTTVAGVQLLNGMPLEQTEIWRREAIPHRAHIPEMLERAGLVTAHIGLGPVRAPGLGPAIAAAAKDHDAVVCDAETEADLQAIAVASARLGPGTIWAGSAGLARALPHAAGLAQSPAPISVPPADGPILFVVGSLSRVSRAQVALLQDEAGMRLVTVAPATLRAGSADPGWMAQDALLADAIGSGDDVIALLGSEDRIDLAEGLRLCHALARMVAPHAHRIGALVSTGGETARAVLQAFGHGGLHLVGEVQPGVPLSMTEGPRHMPVVTKAGAFGTPDILIRCRAILRAGTSPSALSSEIQSS
jgi:4-hydroxythreonine-4-phosphate dehydrogenase